MAGLCEGGNEPVGSLKASAEIYICKSSANRWNIAEKRYLLSLMADPNIPPGYHASSPLLEMASLRLPDSEEYEFENRRRADSLFTSSSTDSSSSTLHLSTRSQAYRQLPWNVSNRRISEGGNKLVDFIGNTYLDLVTMANNNNNNISFNAFHDGVMEASLQDESASGFNASNVNATLGNATEPIPFYRHTFAMTAVYCFAYILVFAVGLVGNCFVIAVVYRSPRMRTVTNFFIVNLAVADILVIVFCLPATLLSNIFVREYSFITTHLNTGLNVVPCLVLFEDALLTKTTPHFFVPGN
ncbi:hypothetical protein ANN_16364 [Periplaneta americana]|uniref:G-protein coupled receptors family 1 profile domain-containing protein n=1 Tax=Periplaneta americana TaxID=6978 RepID=A0ABQ8SJW8_PERAM|nr:hypothetical protein ANN_16364 [Periplaneta americana]